ncbi:MAG: leucine-rich repeat domain-containing protein [Bacteroidales bacterium]|nr:leucine-rich repeat domain-containing protein [Bacteroidales bacterium]
MDIIQYFRRRRRQIVGLMLLLAVHTVAAADFTHTTPEGHVLNFDTVRSYTWSYNVAAPRGAILLGCDDDIVGPLTLPDSVEFAGRSWPVVCIAPKAFESYENISDVNLPSPLQVIGTRAFAMCHGITNIDVPMNIPVVFSDAFLQVLHLTTFDTRDFINGAYSLNGVYRNNAWYSDETYTTLIAVNRQLTSFVIPLGVTLIASNAFNRCRKLERVTIPSTVATINSYAFNECTNLAFFDIPATVTSIYPYAFYRVLNVNYEVLPLDSKGEFCQNCFYADSLFYTDSTKTELRGALRTIHSLHPSDSVRTMSEYACYYCTQLSEIQFPSSLHNIPSFAFYNCRSLQTLSFPQQIDTILANAFLGCSGLQSLTLPNSLRSVDELAFEDCKNIKNIYFDMPDGASKPMLYVGDSISVTLGPHVDSIGNQTFINPDNRSGIKTLTLLGTQRPNWGNKEEVIVPPYNGTLVASCVAMADCLADTSWNIFSTYQVTDYGTTQSTRTDLLEGRVWFRFNCDNGTVTLTVEPYDYYSFQRWSDGSQSNPRTLSLSQNWWAYCFFDSISYFIEGRTADPNMGYVTGTGIYLKNKPAYLTAHANEGYYFSQWTDGNEDFSRRVMSTRDATYTAYFARMKQLSLFSADTAMGVCSGGGYYRPNDYADFAALPKEGYYFMRWSDGNTNQRRAVLMTNDLQYTAYFARMPYIEAVSADSLLGECTGSGFYRPGTYATLTARAYRDCEFVRWDDGDTSRKRTVLVMNDRSYKAYFREYTNDVATASDDPFVLSVQGRTLRLQGCRGETVQVFDLTGRRLANRRADDEPTLLSLPASGVYLVKVGQRPARKVVVF